MAKQETRQAVAGAYVAAKAKELQQKEDNKRRKSSTQVQVTARYDPCAPATRAEVKTLNDYVKKLPGYPKRDLHTSVAWYYDLRTPKEWLHDTQVDAGLDLMRLRQKEHPEWFRSNRLTFIDTLMGNLWQKHYPDFVTSGEGGEVMPTARRLPPGVWDYHTGELPLFLKSNKTWGLEIDIIYTALHIGGNHWIALMISIPDRHVTIWDSIIRPNTDEVVGSAVAPICEIMPFVMHCLAPGDESWKFTLDRYTYTIVKNPEPPQNKQTGDCGVYCLKYIEFHSLGMPFPTWLCDKNMKTCRDKLAYEILTKLGRTGVEEHSASENDLMDVYLPPLDHSKLS